ncbi:MAG: DsrE family protein [Sulfuricellaceae bacterium]|nr:DsrE family protein [Sulfuricellaceae bacterium]
MLQTIFRWFLLALMLGLSSGQVVAAEPEQGDLGKFVFHITESDSARGLLNNARNLLESSNGKVKIVVVANGAGLDFLLQEAADKNGNPYNIAIEGLQAKGIEFRACNNTMKARKIDPAKLVGNIQVVPAGISEVARLQAREGYYYIKP